MEMLRDLSIKCWAEASVRELFRAWERSQWDEWRNSVYGPDYGSIKGIYTKSDPVAAIELAYSYPHSQTSKQLTERISRRREEFSIEVEALIPELEEAAKKFQDSIGKAVYQVLEREV